MTDGDSGASVGSPGRAFYLITFAGPLLGIALIVLLAVLEVSNVVMGIGFVLAGALLGLSGLWLDERLRARPERRASQQDRAALEARIGELQDTVAKRERRETLLTQAETDAACYLGFVTTGLPMAESLEHEVHLIGQFCSALGLRLTDEEETFVGAPSLASEQAERLCEVLLAKRSSLAPQLRCFFQLGATMSALNDEVKRWRRTAPALSELQALQDDPFLQLDPRYAVVVDRLVDLLGPYRDLVPDGERDALKETVLGVLEQLHSIRVPDIGPARRPLPVSPWYWVMVDKDTPAAVRYIGHMSLLALNENSYELSSRGSQEEKVAVTRDTSGWRCSVHAHASEADPCGDITLVLDMTGGGQPVTEARRLLVRDGEASTDATSQDSPSAAT